MPFSTEAEIIDGQRQRSEITKTDFYIDGLSGCSNSAQRRDMLAARLGLPAKMTANSLLEALKILCTYEEYKAHVSAISPEETTS